MAQGKETEAIERLTEVLKTGKPESQPAMRSYHARAHALLASLCEQSGSETRLIEAAEHLRAAQPLVRDLPLLHADIENQSGLLEQARGRYPEARSRFEAAMESARRAKSEASEAIAWNNLGLLNRERGDFAAALTALERALKLSRRSGEILQVARYRQNRALVLKDLGRFGEAFPEMEAADDQISVYGSAEDRRRSEAHRRGLEEMTMDATGWSLGMAEIAARGGPRFRALEAVRRLKDAGKDVLETELAQAIAAVAALDSPLLRADLFARLSAILDQWGLKGLAGRLMNKTRAEVRSIHDRLPEEMRWMRKRYAA
jgi:tetratricopeptide (TPR) repeat protein